MDSLSLYEAANRLAKWLTKEMGEGVVGAGYEDNKGSWRIVITLGFDPSSKLPDVWEGVNVRYESSIGWLFA